MLTVYSLSQLFSPSTYQVNRQIQVNTKPEKLAEAYFILHKPPNPTQQWNIFVQQQLVKEQARLTELKRQSDLEAARAAEAQRQVNILAEQQKAVTTPQNTPQAIGGSIESIIIKWANNYGVDANWLLRVAKCESGFNTQAHNPSGATGLFQFMPSTFIGNAARIGLTNPDIYNPEHQAQVAAYMFSVGQARQWVCQ